MNRTSSIKLTVSETVYEKPLIQIVNFSAEDIILASTPDENQGEWDDFGALNEN